MRPSMNEVAEDPPKMPEPKVSIVSLRQSYPAAPKLILPSNSSVSSFSLPGEPFKNMGPTVWIEPADPAPAHVGEEPGWAEFVSKFVPTWASEPIPEHLTGGPVVSVRRIVDPQDPAQKPSLKQALYNVIDGTVELADNGPFYEDDLRFSGGSRLIRARPGFRPLLTIERSQTGVVRERSAVFILPEGKNLILDGLDLVVDVNVLSSNQSAFFLCQGSTVTLRNCTITVINNQRQTFAVFQTEAAPHPSRIRLERSLIRGWPYLKAFELGKGPVEVALLGSAIVGGRSPLIACARPEAGSERRVHILRSLLACSGPIIELDGLSQGGRPNPVVVRAFESTFGRFEGTGKSKASMVGLREDAAAGELMSWTGNRNIFAGWSDWVSAGANHTVKVADLDAARWTWPNTDLNSKMKGESWPIPIGLDLITATHLRDQAPELLATLVRMAAPSPYLMEKTIGRFSRFSIPAILPDVLAAPTIISVKSPQPITQPLNPIPNPRVLRELAFDPEALPWKGDLGLFLNQQIRPDDKRIRVKVKYGRNCSFTPVRVRHGISLEIVYDPTPSLMNAVGHSVKLQPLNFTPFKGARGEALIDVHGGDLLISNVRFERDAASRLKSLILVEDGHLILDRCWFQARGGGEVNGGGLITFRASSTRRLINTSGVFNVLPDQPIDRPICRLIDCLLITGGDAVTAEMGRGFIALTQCAIAAGGTALSLVPAKVARSAFDVGLSLDRCTLSAEKSFVLLGRWPGNAPGPERPWVLKSQRCASCRTSRGRAKVSCFASSRSRWRVGPYSGIPSATPSRSSISPPGPTRW